MFRFIFLIFGLALIIYGIHDFLKGMGSRKWKKMECVITESEVKITNGVDADGFEPIVNYTYEVGGRGFQGSRIRFNCGTWSEEDARAIVAYYPGGAKAKVFVSLKDPASAVLQTGIYSATITGFCLGAILLLAGVFYNKIAG